LVSVFTHTLYAVASDRSERKNAVNEAFEFTVIKRRRVKAGAWFSSQRDVAKELFKLKKLPCRMFGQLGAGGHAFVRKPS